MSTLARKVAKRDASKLIFVLVVRLVNKFEFSCFARKLNFPDKVPFSPTFKNLLLKSQSVYQSIIYPRQRNQIIPLKYIRVS